MASVVVQTWRSAELILVDDASDDDTPSVLQGLQYCYGSDWIKIVHQQENRGPSVARNIAWDIAGQPYIAFLDADDAWHPRKIEIQLKYMQAHPEVAITGHRARWLRERKPLLSLSEQYTIKPIARLHILISNFLFTPTVMLKKGLDFRFEPAKRYVDDHLLWLNIICSGHKGAFIDLDLAYFYKAPYGAGGLSGQLWKMEKSELDNYRRLRDKLLISWPAFIVLIVWSLVKYVRRVVISKLRAVRYET